MTVNKQISEQWQQLVASQDIADTVEQVVVGSDYVRLWGERHADRAEALLTSGDIVFVYDADGYSQRLALMLSDVADETALHQQLRYFRQREMVRIIWRDLAGLSDLAETVRDLSFTAEQAA